MKLLTTDGLKNVTVKTCTSKKTGKTVFLYKTQDITFLSAKPLKDGANVSRALEIS
jgi:hypothetical protein